MNWNDYEAAWKRQPLPAGAGSDRTRETFEIKRRKLAAMLLRRDWIEIGACVVTVVSYVSFWRKVGSSGWPMMVTILLVLGVGAVFLRERLRTWRTRLGADAPLLAKLEADLAELRHQRRLLRKVWAWFLAPCATAILIHASVIIAQTPPGSHTREPLSIAGVVVFVALLCWAAWAINCWSVRKQIEPRLAELEKMHGDILGLK